MTNDLEKLEAALEKAAALVVENPVYPPIFHRITCELENLQDQKDLIEQAKAIAQNYKAVA